MKSSRQSSKHLKDCDTHQYCIHQHYQKCKTARQSQIAYNVFPRQNLNALVNIHPKCTNQKSFNLKTLAYQKFFQGKEPETQSERNFVKNYYLENVPQKMCMTNNIVKELQEQIYPYNAYNLAEGATKDYYAFEYKRKQYLLTAQKRAKNNSNQFVKILKQENEKNFDERSKWIQRILATLQDLGQRMFNLSSSNKQNEAENGKQRIFLNQKIYVNEKYLKEYKIKDVETSQKIFQDLRAIMLKKKKRFEDEKIKNKNVNLTISQIDQNQSQSASQSMISAVSEPDKEECQEKIINDLCDFENLKKKWKVLDVQRIKDIILSTLTRKVILNCQAEKAKQISTYQRQCKSIPSKLQNSKVPLKNDKKKRSLTSRKRPQCQMKVVYKNKLTKEESQTKDKLLKSGQFDALGSKYEKTRNFSNLFKKKQQSMRLDLSFIDLDNSIHQKIKQSPSQTQDVSGKNNRSTIKGYKTARSTCLRL